MSANVTFGIFDNDRKQADNHPDRRGRIEITENLLREMVDMRKQNKLPVLEIAAWESTTKADIPKDYLYCKVQVSEYWTNRRAEEAKANEQAPEKNESVDSAADDDPFA